MILTVQFDNRLYLTIINHPLIDINIPPSCIVLFKKAPNSNRRSTPHLRDKSWPLAYVQRNTAGASLSRQIPFRIRKRVTEEDPEKAINMGFVGLPRTFLAFSNSSLRSLENRERGKFFFLLF